MRLLYSWVESLLRLVEFCEKMEFIKQIFTDLGKSNEGPDFGVQRSIEVLEI